MKETSWPPERIKALRNSYGELQEEFCLRFRVPLGTYRWWEQGKGKVPGPATVVMDILQEQINAKAPTLQTA